MHFHRSHKKQQEFRYFILDLPTQCLRVVEVRAISLPRWPLSKPYKSKMSRRMGKPTICIGENKGADQLRSNCEADQHLCFRYTDGTIPLLSKSKISSLYPSSVLVQLSLCRTWSEPKLLVLSRTGSNEILGMEIFLSVSHS